MFAQSLARSVLSAGGAPAGLRSVTATASTALRAGTGTLLIDSLRGLSVSDERYAVQQSQQTRSMVTKRRVYRQQKKARKAELAAKGIFPPKPPRYIDKNTPVKNAVSREERDAESRRQDELAAAELKAKLEVVKNSKLMRLGFEDSGLVMSDRVRKLLDLHNGNQKEVVKAQKRRGMELFERREGDTGSSAVQVIALTTRIQQLQTHLRTHRKDNHSKRGLDAMYVRRRKLLDYMERKEFDMYRKVVKTLGLAR